MECSDVGDVVNTVDQVSEYAKENQTIRVEEYLV